MDIRASSLNRLAKCPGSLSASYGLKSKASAESLSGDMVHDALHKWAKGQEPSVDHFGEHERIVFHWFCNEVSRLGDEHGGIAFLWPEKAMEAAIEGGHTLTGHPDLVMVCEDGTVHVIDYKTGYKDQGRAAQSMQLLGYVVLLNRLRPDWKAVYAHLFNAGGSEDTRFTCAVYDEMAIGRANVRTRLIAWKAADPEAERKPGPWCEYCPAKCTARCPKTLGEIDSGAEVMWQDAAEIEPAERVRLYRTWKKLKAYGKKFEDDLKAEVMENPEAWEPHGITLKEGKTRRKITDNEAACKALLDMGHTEDEIWPEVTITAAKCEKIHAAKAKDLGVTQKDAKEQVKNALSHLIEETQDKPTMEIKEEE